METLELSRGTAVSPENPAPGNRKGIFHSVFAFFASLRLAIFVLLSLMVVFAAGTFVESWYGTETASLVVYQSPWFNLLLILLGINVTAAALDRLPWKKKHTGFVITHVGIVLILAGSFISRALMIDGQIALEEGKTEHLITLSNPALSIYSEKQKKEWSFPLQRHPFAWSGRKQLTGGNSLQSPFELSVLKDYPKSRMQENLEASAAGPAALQVVLKNSFINQSQWLVENHPDKGNIQMGPAKIRFTDELLPETQENVGESGYLEFQFQKSDLRIPLKPDLKLPAKELLAGTPYSVTILRVLKKAAIENGELKDEAKPAAGQDGESLWENPAAELLLEGDGLSEKHTVFAKYPDFPTQHGLKPSSTGVRIYYRLPGGGSRGETHELRFVQKEGRLYYQVQTGFKVKTGEAKIGEELQTGWMDLVFKVETFYPHAEINRLFSPEPNTSRSEQVFPAVQVQIENAGEQKELWLRQGFPEKIEFGAESYLMIYGQKRISSGFRLALKDFRVEQYPGTNNPASFESDVILKDDARGVQREATISMNKPLIYRGFRIYQSGYNQAPGEPDVSIFAVGRDPGVPVKYLGAIVMIMGMIIMFSMRKFSTSPEKIA